MSTQTFWILLLLGGLGTFAWRASFLGPAHGEVSPLVRRVLRLVPASALAALVAPSVLTTAADGAAWIRPVAAVAAILVARWSRSILATIVAGMVVLWVALGLT